MSAAEQKQRPRRTLSDVYADRPLTQAQVRRIVALLQLTERPAERSRSTDAEAA